MERHLLTREMSGTQTTENRSMNLKMRTRPLDRVALGLWIAIFIGAWSVSADQPAAPQKPVRKITPGKGVVGSVFKVSPKGKVRSLTIKLDQPPDAFSVAGVARNRITE